MATRGARAGQGAHVIPSFNHSGVLPPFIGDAHGADGRSPYLTNLAAMSRQLVTTDERHKIFEGLLRYRASLRAAGLVEGFQWIDGSFVEAVELTRQRPPSDVDVVTFGWRPKDMGTDAWAALVLERADLFDPKESKRVYQCDAYFVDLGVAPSWLVMQTAYWSGLFSHQRDTFLWKGLLQIDLNKDMSIEAAETGHD